MFDLLYVLAGVLILYGGAEGFVKGSAGLARSFGVSQLAVGLTVVAYGTSAPELVVSLVAALDGKSAIALGNVVGSNISNLGFILGVVALISPPMVDGTLIRREIPLLLVSALSVPWCLRDGVVDRTEGVILTLAALVFTVFALRTAKTGDASTREEIREEVDREAGAGSKPKLLVYAVLGLAALIAGGKLFVDGAIGLALTLGMSERVVGLTIVAVGTSLPELATSIIAAYRGHSAIAVGNIVGSNIFNILFILGVTSSVRPVHAELAGTAFDIGAMIALSLAAAIFLRTRRRLLRIEGLALLVLYVAFVVRLLINP